MLAKIKTISETVSPYVWGQVIKSKNNVEVYQWLMAQTSNLPLETTIKERIYIVLNPQDSPYCDKGKKRRYDDKKQQYMFCGRISTCECYQAYHKENYKPLTAEVKENIIAKRKDTWTKKYGVDNPSKNDTVKNKRKTTFEKTNKQALWEKIKKDKIQIGYTDVVNRVSNNVTPLFSADEYQGSSRKNRYLWSCITCNHQFLDHIDYGRYPKCNKCFPNQQSQDQRDILEYVESLDVPAYPNSREVLKNLEYDIWIPSKNLAIEYNGNYWHSDIWKDPMYHYEKFARSREKNVKLIQIFEDEWKTKPDIIKARLKSLLGKAEKISARKCMITQISPDQYKEFVNKYHLQGYAAASIKLGLIYQDQIVAVMSFGTSRYTAQGFEMIRYCSKGNVIGGASKLFVHFVKNYRPDTIISYANRCWSDGGLYEKLGFTNVTKNDNNVGYWYIKGDTRYHRSSFTKKRLVSLGLDPSKTESQIMADQGFLKIYDAGNYAYEWKTSSTL